MGWTSHYTTIAPTTAERKEELIHELTFTNDKVESVAFKATMRGSTGYALQKIIDNRTGEETVYSVAMLTSYRDNQYAVKFVDPILFYNNFPVTWIDKITPRDEEHSQQLLQWRDNIENTTFKKKQLKELNTGSIIHTDFYGNLVLMVHPNGKRYWMIYDENGNYEGYVPTRRFGANYTLVKEVSK